jgi:hypothetical protein
MLLDVILILDLFSLDVKLEFMIIFWQKEELLIKKD